MKLIDEDEAFKFLSAYYKHRTAVQNSALHDALSRVPTVDAVPVIRCKGCKHWQCDDSESYCDELGIFGTSPTSYCSFAKRREE